MAMGGSDVTYVITALSFVSRRSVAARIALSQRIRLGKCDSNRSVFCHAPSFLWTHRNSRISVVSGSSRFAVSSWISLHEEPESLKSDNLRNLGHLSLRNNQLSLFRPFFHKAQGPPSVQDLPAGPGDATAQRRFQRAKTRSCPLHLDDHISSCASLFTASLQRMASFTQSDSRKCKQSRDQRGEGLRACRPYGRQAQGTFLNMKLWLVANR